MKSKCTCREKKKGLIVTNPRTAYNFYLKSLTRSKATSLAQHQKYAAQQWKTVSNEEKKEYSEKAEKDLLRYKTEIKMLNKFYKIVFKSKLKTIID